jgi:hypothetical protein
MISPKTEKEITRIAERLLDAALQRWRNNEELRGAVLALDAQNPLGPYFERLAYFILARLYVGMPEKEMIELSFQFKDMVAEADALETIFDQAYPILLRSGIDPEAMKLMKTLRGAVKALTDCAYAHTPVREPSNENAFYIDFNS